VVQHRLYEVALSDLSGTATFDEVGAALSQLADQAVELALAKTRRLLAPRFPSVVDLRFAVIAMGKWGGSELNYASDIDLLFLYEPVASDEPDASRRLAIRVATSIIEELSLPGPEGIAFRVDADLRPEGSTGPLVRTIGSYRGYYENWGEPWEFQALLKARPAAGNLELATAFIDSIAPLVWPDSLSSDHVRALRELKARAEDNAEAADLKRAPGGIRDVEFSVQLLQLIHGRSDSTLRVTGTLSALEALAGGGYVRPTDAADLADSYRWLRTVEHRLQLWQLAQTHRLPDDRENLSLAMGLRTEHAPASIAFDIDLNRHRTRVRELHESLYYRPLLEAFASASASGLTRAQADARLQALGFRDLSAAAMAFEDLTAGLSRRSRLMSQLLPLMLDWLADTPNPDAGLQQLRALVAANNHNSELIGTLRDRPLAARRLCLLLGSSRLVGTFIDRLPEFLPRLADDRLLTELPAGAETRAVALERMQLRPDRETRMGSLRRLIRRRILRVAAADLLEMVEGDRIAAALSDTADAAAAAALWTAEQETDQAGLAVVAMGKWGGQELGYGSDLDLIYVANSRAEASDTLRLATEFRSVLGEATPDGSGYQVDAGLRPEGRQGALVRSLDAYRSYYLDRAEPWERLALIRARPVAGTQEVAQAFEEIVAEHAYPTLVGADMVRSIRHIKARVEKERVPTGEDPDFHLKLGPGGLSDIEFLVQMLQLRVGHSEPLARTSSTVGGLRALEGLGLLTAAETAGLAESYQLCTRIRNRLFLQIARPYDSLPIDGEEAARLARSLGYDNRAVLREEYRRVTRRARRIFEKRFYGD
jgi:glutamate-ammonia-ligase adenylyltransferase